MNELAPVEERGELTPISLISKAIENKISPDQLGKLYDLQERFEKNEAAKAFSLALAQFQSRMPVVFKSRTAKVKDWQYSFASYDDVMRDAAPILADCKIALSFSTEPAQGGIKVTCRVRHGTHFEDHTLTVPIPAMTVNDTQRFGAALSYAKRYALCAALNIVVSDEDDDASRQMELVNAQDLAQLKELIEEKRADMERFMKWAGVKKLEEMTKDTWLKAMDMLRRKQA